MRVWLRRTRGIDISTAGLANIAPDSDQSMELGDYIYLALRDRERQQVAVHLDNGVADLGELGVLKDAVESLNHPGLDRKGLKSMLEGVR